MARILVATVLGCLSATSFVAIGCAAKARAVPERATTKTAEAAAQIERPAAPESPGDEGQAVEVLRKLLDSKALRLSTGQGSAASRFHFTTEVVRRTPRGDRLTTDILVVRDGEGVAMLCTSPSGLPYCYLSPGLLITTDRVRPGGLLMYRRGAPVFRLEADQDNRLNLGLGYSGRLNQPIVILDLGSLLRSTLATLQQAAFNQSEASITVRTRNGSVTIVLSTPTDQESPPIKSLMVVNSELGQSVTVIGIGVKSPPPLDLLNLDVDSVLKLELPVRALADRDVRRFDLFVPPDFATDPRERVAAQRLLELLVNANERPEQRPKIDRRIQVRAELVAQAPTMR